MVVGVCAPVVSCEIYGGSTKWEKLLPECLGF
jgi:hypothetical protein